MLWYILMGAVIVIEAVIICVLIDRAVTVISAYEENICELENEIRERNAVTPRETVDACKKVFEEEW